MYGSIDGVKDNLPKLRKYIKEESDPSFAADLDISTKTIQRVLIEYTDHINAALALRYKVPFTDQNIPTVINVIANDLAAFKIARSYMTTISAEENQQLNSLRKDAKETLAALVSGDYVIPGMSKRSSSLESELEDLNSGSDGELFDLEDVATWQAKV